MTITYRNTKGAALTHTELDNNFLDLDTKVLYNFGWEDWNATNGPLTISRNAHTKVLNNGAGANSRTTHKIPGRGNIWNPNTSQFEWDNAGLVVGDTVDIRFDFVIDTSGTNHDIIFGINLGVGGPINPTLTLGGMTFKSSGTQAANTRFLGIYMGAQDIVDYPADIWIQSDATGDKIEYKGHYVRYNLRSPSET